MADVQPLLGGEIESQPVDKEDVVPARPSTRGRGGRQGEPRHEPKDRAWAVAFMLNMTITVISAVYFHKAALTAIEHLLVSRGWHLSEYRSGGTGAIVLACVLVVPSAYALSRVLLLVVSWFSAYVLQLTFAGSAVVGFSTLFWTSSPGVVLGMVVLALSCTVIAGVVVLRNGRIDLAAANLKVSLLAVKSIPSILAWALCAKAFRLMLLVVASIASFGSVIAFQTVLATDGTTYRGVDCHNRITSVSTAPSCECNGNIVSYYFECEYSMPNIFLVCFWVFSTLWSMSVTFNVVAATIAVSVETWWSSPDNVGTVWTSFGRVIDDSLGSVSKAAVIGVLITTGTTLSASFTALYVSMIYGVDPMLFVKLATYAPLTWVALAEINTVFFISMYGLGISEAARRMLALYRKDGRISTSKGSTVAWALYPVILAGSWILSCSKAESLISSLPGIVTMVIFGAVYVTIVATRGVVLFAFKAVYICFIENPEAFSASHDRSLYGEMYKAWRKMKLPHPTLTDESEVIRI